MCVAGYWTGGQLRLAVCRLPRGWMSDSDLHLRDWRRTTSQYSTGHETRNVQGAVTPTPSQHRHPDHDVAPTARSRRRHPRRRHLRHGHGYAGRDRHWSPRVHRRQRRRRTPTPGWASGSRRICTEPTTDSNLDGAVNDNDSYVRLWNGESAGIEAYGCAWRCNPGGGGGHLGTTDPNNTYILPRYSQRCVPGGRRSINPTCGTWSVTPLRRPAAGTARQSRRATRTG